MRLRTPRRIDDLYDKYLLGYDIIINSIIETNSTLIDATVIKDGLILNLLFIANSDEEKLFMERVVAKINADKLS